MNKRKFILGDEWVYVKIYTGASYADQLLIKTLFPLMKKLMRQKTIDKWFFVRYTDEHGFHLRLRCHIFNRASLIIILQSLYECLRNKIKNHLIHNMAYDTYNRELERYGIHCYDDTESIFHLSSHTICAVLSHISTLDVDNEQERMKAAILLITGYINALGLDQEGVIRLLRNNRDAFMAEFYLANSEERFMLDKKYRTHKNFMESIFNNDNRSYVEKVVKSHIEAFNLRFADIRDNILVDLCLYISTLIHMTINRMFISSNREYELIIYYYLYKYYESQLKRIKYNKR